MEKDQVDRYAKDMLTLTQNDFDISVYGTTIYDLYDKMILDGCYASVVSFLKDEGKLDLPDGVRPDEAFNSIYLVFDFDPQDPRFNFDHILQCAQFFSDETRNGKLYLNFPMFESLFDIQNQENTWVLSEAVSVKGLNGPTYKKSVKKRSVISGFSISSQDYPKIIRLHECRYRKLMSIKETTTWPGTNLPALVRIQRSSMEGKKTEIAILNTFALLILDYNPTLLPK